MLEKIIRKILVLDEPTAGLDLKERVRFRNMIADWIFLMKQGQFIAQGALETLKEHYFEVTHSERAETFNLEKLYLFYFAEGDEEYDVV